jgi:uncharacterized membrane protein YkoI
MIFKALPVLVALGVASGGPAHARIDLRSAAAASQVTSPAGRDGSVAQLPNRRAITLAEATLIAQMRHPGRVTRAQTIQLGNGAIHEIRIIGNDGRVHTVRVDASTGEVR